jgi:hypothetical protein
MGFRSVNTSSNHITPSALALQTDLVARYLQSILVDRQNRVSTGLTAGAPTTGSSQLTGTGATTWNVNVAAGVVVVAGVAKDLAAAADTSIHASTQLVTNGQSCIAALVAKNVSGTISVVAVKGSAATTGAQVAPTDAAIQTAVGAGNAWVKLAECTINRTGDTTVTQSQDNSKRPMLGVNVDTEFATLTAV